MSEGGRDDAHRIDVRDVVERILAARWSDLVTFARQWAPAGSEAIAEEIVQEASMTVLEKEAEVHRELMVALDEGEGDMEPPAAEVTANALVEAFLRGVIRNCGRNVARHEQRRGACHLPASREPREGSVRSPWTAAETVERRKKLQAASRRVTAAELEVVQLHGIEGWTVREVAEHRGTSPKTVKEQYRKALRKLRDALGDDCGP